MSTQQPVSRRNYPLLYLLVIISLLFCINSCKNKEAPETLAGKCAVLKRGDIQYYWVDPGYTKPGNKDFIDTIDVQSEYYSASTTFKISVSGTKKDGSSVKNSNILILNGNTCQPPQPISIPTHNYFAISQLDILDNTGKLKKFKYLVFTPTTYQNRNETLNFEISIVDDNNESKVLGYSLPCPPCYNCKPPNCPPALKEDSLNKQSSS